MPGPLLLPSRESVAASDPGESRSAAGKSAPPRVDWLASNVTGDLTYWRVFGLTILGFVALALAAPLALRSLRSELRWATTGLLVAAALVLVPAKRIYVSEDTTRFAPLSLSVPEGFDRLASFCREVGSGRTVLVPLKWGPWVRTLRGAPMSLVSRPHYLVGLVGELGEDEVRRRLDLAILAGNPIRRRMEPDTVLEAAASGSLAGLWLTGIVPGESMRLRQLGFVRVAVRGEDRLWVLPEVRRAP